METFDYWAEISLFDTNCFIIGFQLQLALQKQQKTLKSAESTQCTLFHMSVRVLGHIPSASKYSQLSKGVGDSQLLRSKAQAYIMVCWPLIGRASEDDNATNLVGFRQHVNSGYNYLISERHTTKHSPEVWSFISPPHLLEIDEHITLSDTELNLIDK